MSEAETKNDLQVEANALLSISDTYIAYGNNSEAYKFLSRSLKLKNAFNDDKATAHLYYNLAIVLSRLNNMQTLLNVFTKQVFYISKQFLGKDEKKIR